MAPRYDANEQTGVDMANARAFSSITVEAVRDFLYRELKSLFQAS